MATGAGKRGQRANAAQRKATEDRRAKVTAAKADRASQTRRKNAWQAGNYPMSEWTDEEIRRGRVGSDEGEFYGSAPRLSRKQQKELRIERGRRVMYSIQDTAPAAVSVIREAMVHAPFYGDRLRAAGMILDRSHGKAPERIIVTDEDPFSDIMDDVVEHDRSGVKKSDQKRKGK